MHLGKRAYKAVAKFGKGWTLAKGVAYKRKQLSAKSGKSQQKGKGKGSSTKAGQGSSTKAGQGSSTKAKAKKKGGDSTKKSLDIDIISHNVPSRVTRSTSKLTNSEDCEKMLVIINPRGPNCFLCLVKKGI